MATPLTTQRWDEAPDARARGTVIVLAGRGESPEVYNRLGRRLAADAYRVRAVADPTALEADPERLVRALIAESTALPAVLLGSDTGALLALKVAAADAQGISAVIAAGLPAHGSVPPAEADAIAARSACVVHQSVLSDPGAVVLDAYQRAVPGWLAPAAPGAIDVPVLGIHGEDDAIAGLAAAREYYAGFTGDAELVVVPGGRHDILNDVSHRSVAATIVLFLERLRADGTPTIRREDLGPVAAPVAE